jgi:hypothetical protein
LQQLSQLLQERLSLQRSMPSLAGTQHLLVCSQSWKQSLFLLLLLLLLQ